MMLSYLWHFDYSNVIFKESRLYFSHEKNIIIKYTILFNNINTISNDINFMEKVCMKRNKIPYKIL